jgi:regulator of replication initiation timing
MRIADLIPNWRLHRRIKELESEADELRRDIVAMMGVDVRKLSYEDGKFSAELSGKRFLDFVSTLVHEQFTEHGGPNFVTMSMIARDADGKFLNAYDVTIQRVGAESLAEQLGRLRYENDKLKRALAARQDTAFAESEGIRVESVQIDQWGIPTGYFEPGAFYDLVLIPRDEPAEC